MSHHKYHTDSLVIGVVPRGESDALVILVTKELGMIQAVAKGVRLAKSKNRMSLIEGTLVRASLVKGKDTWRLTNVMFVESFSRDLAKDILKLTTAWNIHLLLRRIVPRDVLPSTLFQIVLGLWKTLVMIPVELVRSAECIALLNIVHELGYLGEEISFTHAIGVYEPSSELLQEMIPKLREATETINNSLKATHL